MKPSEIIAAALASGELQKEDVVPLPAEGEQEDSVVPPAPPSAQLEGTAAAEDGVEEEDSDRESDYAPVEGEGQVDGAEAKQELDAAEEEEVRLLSYCCKTVFNRISGPSCVVCSCRCS